MIRASKGQRQKKIISLLLALATVLSLSLSALASSYTDVSDGAWYVDTVGYVTEHGLMDATVDGTFAAMLWRAVGRTDSDAKVRFADSDTISACAAAAAPKQ